MATSPFRPISRPSFSGASGNIAVGPYIGGTNSREFLGDFYVVASLGSNASVYQLWECLAAPSNTVKLVMDLVANATTGNAQIELLWGKGTTPFAYDTTSLTSETSGTVSWSAGDAGDVKTHKITMDHTAISAGDIIVCQLRFNTASWTLAQKMHVGMLSIIDE